VTGSINKSKTNAWRWRALVLAVILAVDVYLVVGYGWNGVYAVPIVTVAVLLGLFRRYTALTVWIVLVFLAGFILPAINAAAPAARKVACSNHLREIAAAILQYESDHGAMPCPFTSSPEGKPLHSWRVLILPYLGHQSLYDQIDLNKPWDDPANLKIGDHMPEIYRCQEAQYQTKWRTFGNRTTYVAIVGDNTAWPPTGSRHISEMTTSDEVKLLVIELPTRELHWMAPADPTLDHFLADLSGTPSSQLHGHDRIDHCVCTDGAVRLLGLDRERLSTLLELVTMDPPKRE
jgi:hypothetical protein